MGNSSRTPSSQEQGQVHFFSEVSDHDHFLQSDKSGTPDPHRRFRVIVTFARGTTPDTAREISMKAMITFRCVAVFVVALSFSSALLADPADYDDSVETAWAIHHAASRQADAAANIVRGNGPSSEVSDEAYTSAYNSAVWEGVRLSNPKATIEQRARLALFISNGKSVGDTAAGIAIAAYIVSGKEIDSTAQFLIGRDEEEAFRLGYAQSIKRQIELSH